MTNKEKMLNGMIYDPSDPELVNRAFTCHDLCKKYNQTSCFNIDKREKLITEIFPHHGKDFYVEGNLYVDYGENVYWGDNCYANNGLTILDTCPVHIGNSVFFGPNVSIYTPLHPLRYQERNRFLDKDNGRMTDKEYAKPVTIGDNCWIGGSVTILPGVTIGNGCVIGAGSVVTRSIPDNSLAVGNPCRAIKTITESDSIQYKNI